MDPSVLADLSSEQLMAVLSLARKQLHVKTEAEGKADAEAIKKDEQKLSELRRRVADLEKKIDDAKARVAQRDDTVKELKRSHTMAGIAASSGGAAQAAGGDVAAETKPKKPRKATTPAPASPAATATVPKACKKDPNNQGPPSGSDEESESDGVPGSDDGSDEEDPGDGSAAAAAAAAGSTGKRRDAVKEFEQLLEDDTEAREYYMGKFGNRLQMTGQESRTFKTAFRDSMDLKSVQDQTLVKLLRVIGSALAKPPKSKKG